MKRCKKNKARFAAAVIAAGAALQPLAAAANCLTETEMLAQDLQHFHIQVMVSGNRCGLNNPQHHTLYNQFMTRFAPDLKANQNVLKRYFQRTYGARSVEFFDKYLTAMANIVSSQSNYMPGFCAEIGTSLTNLLQYPTMQEGHANIDVPLRLNLSGTEACALPANINGTRRAE